jgi:acetyl-CoA acyltransferase
MVVAELVQRSEIDPREIDTVIFGQSMPSMTASNLARDIVLAAGLGAGVEAYSVSRACATSLQAIASAAESILVGHIHVAIAGGADSASEAPLYMSRALAKTLCAATSATTLMDRVLAFRSLRPSDFLPVPPATQEPGTGRTMGECAEQMAQDIGISRAAQDAFAHRSHVHAARAWAAGSFEGEVLRAYVPPSFEPFVKDNQVCEDSDPERYAALEPAFRPGYGTVTEGNSSGLTDGGAAVLLMSEDKAKALGMKPLGYLRSLAFAAVDPQAQTLLGPAYATPLALDRAGMTLADMDLVDMHEAFAAQVLSNVEALASTQFAQQKLGRTTAAGEVDLDRFNVLGGSIAMGHPPAATGARMVTQTLRELARRGKQTGLVTLCAAGGLGAAAIVEVS